MGKMNSDSSESNPNLNPQSDEIREEQRKEGEEIEQIEEGDDSNRIKSKP